MKKREAIKKLIAVRKKLVERMDSIPEDTWDEAFLGKWSLFDIAAHLVGWDFENAKSVKEILEGKLPSCFSFWDGNWITYNDILVGRYKKLSKEESLYAMNDSQRVYIRALENIPEYLFDKDIGLRWHEFLITPSVNVDYETQDERIHLKQITIWQSEK